VSDAGARPNLVIIGATKCGTTSLHHYLSHHPDIFMSKTKELRYFEKHKEKDLGWYEQQFRSTAKIRGEASPQYTRHPLIPDVPRRMHAIIPDAKLIYILRDPIDRIVSHYMERLGQFRENLALADVLADERKRFRYVCESRYHSQIEQYLAYYPMSQLLVLTLEDLHVDRQQTLARVFRFLGVDEQLSSPAFANALNESSTKRRKTRLAEWLYPRPMRRLMRRNVLPHPLRRAYMGLIGAVSEPAERPQLPAPVIDGLVHDLRDDFRALRQLTGNDYRQWRHAAVLSGE
jgi:hypothetical protein